MDREVIGDWEIHLAGEVVRVEKQDIDKSGKNPRFVLTIFVSGFATNVPEGAVVPSPVPIRIKESELKVPVVVGSRLRIVARASGPKPTSFYAASIAAS